ncbi:MAG TPA: response regulator [Bacteroidales bacterium]|nr:response regulator [Bacteroidales bacterium]
MQQSKKITILIVDDDFDYLFQLKAGLLEMGFEVITAEGQKEAEKILERLKPDMAILDLMMESHDSGFILSHRIKDLYPDVPIIIVSAVTAETGFDFDVTSLEEQSWIKADLFLDKGIRKDQLQREIFKLLKL